MVLGFLRGQQNPTIEEMPLNPELLGLQWRIVYDFGAGALDYKGAVESSGA